MSGTKNQQQQQQQKQQLKLTSTTTITAETSSSSSAAAFPKTFITAQNCFDQQQNLTLMIKNNEPSSNQTDWDEKEEEKEICSLLERREVVPEDSLKLDTIQESFAVNDSSSSSSSLLRLKSSPNDSQTPTTLVDAADAISTTNNLNTDISLTEEEQQQQTQEEQSTKDFSNENLEEPSSASTTVNIQDTDNNSSTSKKASNNNNNKTPSPKLSPQRKSSSSSKEKISKSPSDTKLASSSQTSLGANTSKVDEDSISKSSDTSGELLRGSVSQENSAEKSKNTSRLSERAKKKSWYNVLYPNYKSRSQDFKKLFKDVPNDERLIVDYSCALQRDILVQGRLYVSQNYVCFHANIFSWETFLILRWKDVTSITKEKTALVIPNAISIRTADEKYFFATFTTRDKAFLMLFRVWQNTLMNKQMLPQEMWKWVHNCYGEELGLTTDDEDYIDPTSVPNDIETDLDYVSAIDDTCTQTISETIISEYNTAIFSNKPTQNKNSKNTSGGGGGSGGNNSGSDNKVKQKKSSKKIYSSTTTTSGSENKFSDNNSGGADKIVKKSSVSSKMKPNAKELTLTSAKPDEISGGGGISGGGSTNAINGNSNNTTVTKENKPTTTTFDGKRKVKNNRQRDESLSKNSGALPTDMSDSSDSDHSKIPFIATAECTSTHEGRQLVHTILPINIETLFILLFSKSKFLVDFHAMRKSTDTNFDNDWTPTEEGQKERTVNVTVQIAASVGPKTSKVTEYQVMRNCSKTGELYSIDVNSVNAGIPYADSFSVLMHYCLVRTVDDNTMLSVHAQIKFKKSIWGVVKGLIEKNTWTGLEDFYTALLHSLQSETCIPPAKAKGRRPRRGNTAQIRPIEETTPAAQVKPETTEKFLTPHSFATQHPATSQVIPVQYPSKYRWLSLFVIILLFLLILLNVILLLKLWNLESRIELDYNNRAHMPNIAAMKELPNSPQDWIELVRQQEILHETELKKWHKVLQTAIELLKKTEKTLAELIFR